MWSLKSSSEFLVGMSLRLSLNFWKSGVFFWERILLLRKSSDYFLTLVNLSYWIYGLMAWSSFSFFCFTSRYFEINFLSYGVNWTPLTLLSSDLSEGALKLNPLKNPLSFWIKFLKVVLFSFDYLSFFSCFYSNFGVSFNYSSSTGCLVSCFRLIFYGYSVFWTVYGFWFSIG